MLYEFDCKNIGIGNVKLINRIKKSYQIIIYEGIEEFYSLVMKRM